VVFRAVGDGGDGVIEEIEMGVGVARWDDCVDTAGCVPTPMYPIPGLSPQGLELTLRAKDVLCTWGLPETKIDSDVGPLSL
jgi:hypothetical protein